MKTPLLAMQQVYSLSKGAYYAAVDAREVFGALDRLDVAGHRLQTRRRVLREQATGSKRSVRKADRAPRSQC